MCPDYFDLSAGLLERSHRKTGNLPAFLGFHKGAAGFPFRQHAAWIVDRLAACTGLDRDVLDEPAAVLSDASEKQKALSRPAKVGASFEAPILQSDGPFQGRVFDPPQI